MKMPKVSFCVGSLLVLFAVRLCGQGQGVVNFSNVGAPPDKRIYYVHMSHTQPGVVEQGPTLLSGSNYRIALYGGPQGLPESALVQIGPAATFLTGPQAGTFSGGNRTISGFGAGPTLSVQARAWSQISGVPDSYEAVLAAMAVGDSRAIGGKGPLFDFKSKDPGNPQEVAIPIGDAAGWQGFCVDADFNFLGCVIPEPSTVALTLFGALVLFSLSRLRKS